MVLNHPLGHMFCVYQFWMSWCFAIVDWWSKLLANTKSFKVWNWCHLAKIINPLYNWVRRLILYFWKPLCVYYNCLEGSFPWFCLVVGQKCLFPKVVGFRTNAAGPFCKHHNSLTRTFQESNHTFLESPMCVLHLLWTKFCVIWSSYGSKVVGKWKTRKRKMLMAVLACMRRIDNPCDAFLAYSEIRS